ncbi:hypothetical protein SDC9_195367 [bioreactor metagenome]|uniref:Uncharacterized protein n=1 Tax=bioreactor metagenome TaxID=1076179 RepID=A0A645IKB4_9ZZZZ
MQLLFFFTKVIIKLTAQAFTAEGVPFGNNLLYPHQSRRSGNEDVEIAREIIFKGGELV